MKYCSLTRKHRVHHADAFVVLGHLPTTALSPGAASHTGSSLPSVLPCPQRPIPASSTNLAEAAEHWTSPRPLQDTGGFLQVAVSKARGGCGQVSHSLRPFQPTRSALSFADETWS